MLAIGPAPVPCTKRSVLFLRFDPIVRPSTSKNVSNSFQGVVTTSHPPQRTNMGRANSNINRSNYLTHSPTGVSPDPVTRFGMYYVSALLDGRVEMHTRTHVASFIRSTRSAFGSQLTMEIPAIVNSYRPMMTSHPFHGLTLARPHPSTPTTLHSSDSAQLSHQASNAPGLFLRSTQS